MLIVHSVVHNHFGRLPLRLEHARYRQDFSVGIAGHASFHFDATIFNRFLGMQV